MLCNRNQCILTLENDCRARSADGSREPVRIIEHPDVRKMLLTGQALTKAGRALAVFTALQMDVAERHPDQDRRRKAEGLVALLTPVVKAALHGFRLRDHGTIPARVRRSRIHSRVGNGAVCARRPDRSDLRRDQRGSGDGSGFPQTAAGRWRGRPRFFLT